jgi:hypothetical protein
MFGGRRSLATLACLCAVTCGAASCGDDGGESAERATVPAAETTTSEATTTTEAAPEFEALVADPNLTPEEQVEAAYLHSWDIYHDALRTGRTEYLELAYIDPSLSGRQDQIDELVAQGQRGIGSVSDQSPTVTMLTPTDAVVIDEYRNHLVLADAATGEPIEEDPDEVVRYSYTFVLEEDVWRISYVERL